jgi:hypothetical protein
VEKQNNTLEKANRASQDDAIKGRQIGKALCQRGEKYRQLVEHSLVGIGIF